MELKGGYLEVLGEFYEKGGAREAFFRALKEWQGSAASGPPRLAEPQPLSRERSPTSPI